MIKLLLELVCLPFIIIGKLLIGILKMIGIIDIFGGRD